MLMTILVNKIKILTEGEVSRYDDDISYPKQMLCFKWISGPQKQAFSW